jgi:hypothetical protein
MLSTARPAANSIAIEIGSAPTTTVWLTRRVGSEITARYHGVRRLTATLRSHIGLKRAEADVARGTVDDRIEESHLNVELLREQLRQARLGNDFRTEQTVQEVDPATA